MKHDELNAQIRAAAKRKTITTLIDKPSDGASVNRAIREAAGRTVDEKEEESDAN